MVSQGSIATPPSLIKVEIVSSAMEYMVTPQLTPAQRQTLDFEACIGYNYGNYFRILTDPAEGCSNGSIGEYGWDGKAGTYTVETVGLRPSG